MAYFQVQIPKFFLKITKFSVEQKLNNFDQKLLNNHFEAFKKDFQVQREHPALQNTKSLDFFSFVVVIFAPESTESGSNPKHWLQLGVEQRQRFWLIGRPIFGTKLCQKPIRDNRCFGQFIY